MTQPRGVIPSKIELYKLYWVEEKTLAEIGQIYGRTPNTVLGWMRKRGLRTRTRQEQLLKTIDGVVHKRCKGPLHSSLTWVPVSNFHRNNRTQVGLRSWCIPCESYRQNSEPRINLGRVYFIFEELVHRLGLAETIRRTNISEATLNDIIKRKVFTVRRRTVRKAITVLHEARINNEVRHKDSIKHGAYLRGRKEKIPKEKSEFYSRADDQDNEYRRDFRRRTGR